MLATDTTVEQTPKPAALPSLENWAGNERMRHIPSLEWLLHKIDVDVRGRLGKLTPAISALPSDDPHRAGLDAQLRRVCKALDRLSETAKPGRANGAPGDTLPHLQWSLEHATAALKAVDANTFGRRHPYHLFEKSRAEMIYGAALAVVFTADALVPLVREVDSSLDERLLEGLVVLQNPVDERMLKPIA